MRVAGLGLSSIQSSTSNSKQAANHDEGGVHQVILRAWMLVALVDIPGGRGVSVHYTGLLLRT